MKLRLLSEDDLRIRVGWMNNPDIYKTMHFIPPISLEKTLEWYHKNKTNLFRYDFAIEDEEGNVVAMGGLTNIDYCVRKAEFYVFVNPSRLRMGFGSIATYLICKYGFEVLNLHKIYLFTNASNMGAKKTYEKIGFKLEGVHRDEMLSNEQFQDRLYYGLINSELDKGKHPLLFSGNIRKAANK